MKIENVRTNGFIDAIRYSGLPKSTEPHKILKRSDWQRGDRLSSAPSGSGHDSFLKGVGVTALITAPQYWWLQFGRYHFADIISSQSKMHMLLKFDLKEQMNGKVNRVILNALQRILREHEQGNYTFEEVLSNVPMGMNLTAGITTNYLQLKGIYNQRRTHRLSEWQTFCNWIEDLEYSEWIIGGDK